MTSPESAPPASLHARILRDLLAGASTGALTVSLGAAFGTLSGMGAFAGMLTAAVLPMLLAVLGGTRVQCSGPTGPMTAVTIAVLAATADGFQGADGLTLTADQAFVTAILLGAGMLSLLAFVRADRLVEAVPRSVLLGFMGGVALIIWRAELGKFAGVGGAPIEGPMALNLVLASGALAVSALGPRLLAARWPRAAELLPAALVALVAGTLLAQALALPVGRTELGWVPAAGESVGAHLQALLPPGLSLELLVALSPAAATLAAVCYLDSLLTSLILDRMTAHRSHRRRELAAQSLGLGLVALLGGIPGAQATERSVLLVREGATSRLATFSAGAIALAITFLMLDLVALVPQALFAGVLVKLGIDVFPWHAVADGARAAFGRTPAHVDDPLRPGELGLLTLTTTLTVTTNLAVAVAVATSVHHAVARLTRGAAESADACSTAQPASPSGP